MACVVLWCEYARGMEYDGVWEFGSLGVWEFGIFRGRFFDQKSGTVSERKYSRNRPLIFRKQSVCTWPRSWVHKKYVLQMTNDSFKKTA